MYHINCKITLILISTASPIFAADNPTASTHPALDSQTTAPVATAAPQIPAKPTTDAVDTSLFPTIDSQLDQPAAKQQEQPQNIPIWQNAHEQKVQEHKAQTYANQRERFEAQRAALNSSYQELLKQAANNGVELPTTPPWTQEPTAPLPPFNQTGLQGQQQVVTPPFRPEYTNNAPDFPQNSSERPDLARMQAVIDAMTPEEREVCTTVHRLSMGLMQTPMTASPPPPEYNYGARYNNNNMGYNKYPNYNTGAGYTTGPGYNNQGYGYDSNYGYGTRQPAPNSNWQGAGPGWQ